MQKELLKQTIKLLHEGELIGLPTETVYGLAADANNESAIKKIFAAKGRPSDHPLIVHIGTLKEAEIWAKNISPKAQKLMQTFWPGPLTLILKKQDHVSNLLTGHQDSIGLRMPNHPMALAILRAFGSALAAPSANRFGHISPTRPEDVVEELADQVALVLPGGQTDIGIESTIVDARTEPFTILRQGAISKEMLTKVLCQEILIKDKDASLRVSGNLPSHYAPETPLLILEKTALEKLSQEPVKACVILAYSKLNLPDSIKVITMPETAEAYAHALYAELRKADHAQAKLIIVEAIPSGGLWDAINDRLTRAAHH